MSITRRDFVTLAAAMAAGCQSQTRAPSVGPARPVIDAGPVSLYSTPGVYPRFRHQGFFLVNDGQKIFALSSMCTHRACTLKPQGPGLECPCHGSTFTATGQVTRGPARRDLWRFAIEKDPAGHLIVHTNQPLSPDQSNQPGAAVVLR